MLNLNIVSDTIRAFLFQTTKIHQSYLSKDTQVNNIVSDLINGCCFVDKASLKGKMYKLKSQMYNVLKYFSK